MAEGRPLTVIARQPRFVVAVICGVVSYLLMNFLMTAAPLAMRLCGLDQEAANLGIQWHIIAMYAPSFFTYSNLHYVTITKFAVDGKVEQRSVANSARSLKPKANGPNLLGLQRPLGAYDPSGIPGPSLSRCGIVF
jgi:hypothetical protein